MKRILAILLTLALLLSNTAVFAENAIFTAGDYEATATGNGGDVTVKVTFSADKIEAIEILSQNETVGIADGALEKVPAEILAAQSTQVDSVSGATITSNALIAAVEDAIRQAGADPAALTPNAVSYEKHLTPGSYVSTQHGHHSNITVETVVTEDAIEAVNILDENDSYNIADLVFDTLPAAIVANQSVGIDTVTGATFTSRAVLSAVEDALRQAGGDEAVMAFSAKVESPAWSEEEITETYDVVVVGSGLSGISAAMAAQDAGAKVLIVEKLPYWGGTSQTVFGLLTYPDHHGEDKEGMTNYLLHRYNGCKQGDTYMDGEYPNPKAVDLYVNNVYDDLKWLETKGVSFNYYDAEEVHGSDDTITDESVVEGVSSYRHTVPWGKVNEDGTVTTEYTWLAYAHYQEPDREPNVAARAMEKMFKSFTENGGTLLLNTTAKDLITDDNGAVIGLKAEGKGGKYTFYAKSVVLCAGGYGASAEAIQKWMPTYAGETNITLPGNTGDGIRMALDVGAKLFDDQFMMGGSGHTMITNEDLISQWRDAETPGAALIVTPSGQRVNSETPESYSNSTMHVNPDSRDYYWIIVNEDVAKSNNVLSDIYDPDSIVGTYQDMLEEQLAAGNERFFKADTIEALSTQIGIVPVNMLYTLHHYNALCEKGEDTDLFKSPENLVAMTEGPWYAVKAYMSYFGTVGGVVTDEHGAVLNGEGTAIPGLYAAGETSNHNMFNLTYLGGFSLGECLVFGHEAGMNAAQYAAQ